MRTARTKCNIYAKLCNERDPCHLFFISQETGSLSLSLLSFVFLSFRRLVHYSLSLLFYVFFPFFFFSSFLSMRKLVHYHYPCFHFFFFFFLICRETSSLSLSLFSLVFFMNQETGLLLLSLFSFVFFIR